MVYYNRVKKISMATQNILPPKNLVKLLPNVYNIMFNAEDEDIYILRHWMHAFKYHTIPLRCTII